MDKKKVLIVTQEMDPYTAMNEISNIARRLPEHIQKQGMEIRILMPKYGTINERRHRLHEVVRLSGMNIIVDDDDFPLIIKVASIPQARMQVYFLDNEDFFKRKMVFDDENGEPFEDNPERMIFFCKGVLETVRKFGWPPDIIHCHGWMTSLLPIYVKEAYKQEPLFQSAKVVYSVYEQEYDKKFDEGFTEKAAINSLEEEDLEDFLEDGNVNLHKGALAFSDALIEGNEELSESVKSMLEASGKPILAHQGEEDFKDAYIEFYHSLLEEEVES
ncbi:MAG: glycogen/starch synthase [Bacteroidota bacterium]